MPRAAEILRLVRFIACPHPCLHTGLPFVGRISSTSYIRMSPPRSVCLKAIKSGKTNKRTAPSERFLAVCSKRAEQLASTRLRFLTSVVMISDEKHLKRLLHVHHVVPETSNHGHVLASFTSLGADSCC